MHRQVSPVGLLNRLPAGPAPLPHPVAPPGCPASRPTCPAHRPALQGCLVLSGLRGLAQQLMVSRTTACGEPQELGETEAQRRPQRDGGRGSQRCGALSLPDLAAQRGEGGSPVREPGPQRTLLLQASSGSWEPPSQAQRPDS